MGCEAGKGRERKGREARKWEGSLRGGVRLAVTSPCTLAHGLRWTPQPRVTDQTRPRTHTPAQRFHAHTCKRSVAHTQICTPPTRWLCAMCASVA